MANPQLPIPRPPNKRAVLNEPLIYERGSPGRIGYSLPQDDVPARDLNTDLPPELCRDALDDFPEVSEEIFKISRKMFHIELSQPKKRTMKISNTQELRNHPLAYQCVEKLTEQEFIDLLDL